ncbi:MAG: DUF1906 domain-containing protein [Acidobacteria bacterium]|nr:DUF1906 domain-containing protein [Acidobacteriota bacterium]
MRQLRLESPPLHGTDIHDWQTFLRSQQLLPDAPDGIFGANTKRATIAYQTQAGILPADGIVGPFTLARAIQGGLVSTAEPLRPGLDSSANCAPYAAQIVAAGVQFVARYYSQFARKTLSLAEARALSAAGLQLITVYQDSNDKLECFTAALGQPSGSAIYFAADFDPSPVEARGPVMEYFHAVHDALSASPFQVGVYGSGLTCRLVRDAGFANFTWLSQSTSFREYLAFLPQADIVQAAPGRPLIPNKLNIDDDIARTPHFGAFQLTA